MAFLKVLTGPNAGRKYPVKEPTCQLGRLSSCEIAKPFAELPYVSRQHAVIEKVGDGYVLRDLQSRHGTQLNGVDVMEPVPLRHGDRVSICEVNFEFCQYDPAEWTDFVDADDSSVDSTVEISSTGSLVMGSLPARADVRLEAMIEMLAGLGGSLQQGELLENILDGLLKVFPQAERGFIGLKQDGEESVVPVAVKHRHPEDPESVRVSRTMLRRVMGAREGVRSTDVQKDPQLRDSDSIHGQRIRSVMCVPLVASDGSARGVMQLDSRDTAHRFEHKDLEVLVAVSRLATVVLEYSRLHREVLQRRATECDLAMARRVQTSLLPHQAPEIPGYRFFEFYRAAYNVGGDYYDYVPLPGDRTAVVVADASGKGVSGALMAATLSGELKYWLGREPLPGRALERVNQRVSCAECEGRFVTVVLAVIDPRVHEMTVANAGHMEPLLRRRNGEIELIGSEAKGLPLGIEPGERYGEETRPLEAGESVTMFSDGFSEAMNRRGQLYGLHRIHQVIRSGPADVVQIGRRIVADVERHVAGGRQTDDMCLTCFGRE